MATFIDYQDDLKTCPYNRLHKVAARRYQAHVNECARSSGVRLMICKFNSTHRVPHSQYEEHLSKCPDAKQTYREMIETINLKKSKKDEDSDTSSSKTFQPQNDYDDYQDDWNSPKEKNFVLNAFKEDSKDKMITKDDFHDPLVIQRMTKSERRRFYEEHLEKQKERKIYDEDFNKDDICIKKEDKKHLSDGLRIPKGAPGFGGIGRGQAICKAGNTSYDYDDDYIKPKKDPDAPFTYSNTVKMGIGRGVSKRPIIEEKQIKHEKN